MHLELWAYDVGDTHTHAHYASCAAKLGCHTQCAGTQNFSSYHTMFNSGSGVVWAVLRPRVGRAYAGDV